MFNSPEYIRITPEGILPVRTPKELVISNHRILKDVMPVFDFNQSDAVDIGNQLVDALLVNKGLGLAAPQIGMAYRAFAMVDGDSGIAFFNPIITTSSKEHVLLEEGCLSFPGMFLKVSRPKEIEVSYPSYDGKQHAAKFDGLTARIFQHELDHLNGVCFTECVGKTTLTMAKNKQAKLLKKLDRTKK